MRCICARGLKVPAGEATTGLLVDGIVDLLHKGSDASLALPGRPSGHPLFKALCTHPAAPQQLLTRLEGLFTEHQGPQAGTALSRQRQCWQPFISTALLDHGEGNKSQLLDSMTIDNLA